jgi:hypothetical protein
VSGGRRRRRVAALGILRPALIGTLRETSLHAALKGLLARSGDGIEVPVAGYVADIVRGDLVIEIQTGSFAALKRKLPRLLEAHHVCLVHPIAVERWIVRTDGRGRALGRRKSPWRGRLEHLFLELVSIPEITLHPRFAFDVMLIREEVVRRPARLTRRRWRPRPVTDERRLLEVVDRVTFESPGDYRRFLPADLPEQFTCRELALCLGQPVYVAQKVAYCLRKMHLIARTGQRRRAPTYAVRVVGTGAPPAEGRSDGTVVSAY